MCVCIPSNNVLFDPIDIHVSACPQTGLTTATAELTNQNHWRESHDLERLTQDMLVHLESSEVTLDNYCSLVVRLSTDRLTNLLSKAGVEREGDTRSDPTSALTATLHLLASAVDLFEVSKREFYSGTLSNRHSV